MHHHGVVKSTLALLATVAALAACSDSTEPELGACEVALQLFPVPVSAATSLFPSVDDSFLPIPFLTGFQFNFYGTTYNTVYLNTNGGMTFGGGDDNYDVQATDVTNPAIAVFWGDLDAEEYSGATRANQMSYQLCEDRFIVNYVQLQDNDEETWNNTAEVTLSEDGTIVVEYGTVLSEDILVGVFDGVHDDDRYLTVQASYAGYTSTGSGIILFDDWGAGPTHAGELSNRTITYTPTSPASYEVTMAERDPLVVRGTERPEKGSKGPKRVLR